MTLNEIYNEFNSYKTNEQKINFLKEIKENVFIKFDINYDNIIKSLSESESA
tara:strand:+ start:106 stop:261 length:156 start_codon:yes stop_codon:yes gene_type:complete